jgi:hypothetical protein
MISLREEGGFLEKAVQIYGSPQVWDQIKESIEWFLNFGGVLEPVAPGLELFFYKSLPTPAFKQCVVFFKIDKTGVRDVICYVDIIEPING